MARQQGSNHESDRQKSSGKKGSQRQQSQEGGSHRQQGGSQENNPGNFANDPERASEAGRKGGQR